MNARWTFMWLLALAVLAVGCAPVDTYWTFTNTVHWHRSANEQRVPLHMRESGLAVMGTAFYVILDLICLPVTLPHDIILGIYYIANGEDPAMGIAVRRARRHEDPAWYRYDRGR